MISDAEIMAPAVPVELAGRARGIQSPGRSSQCVHGEPRQLRKQLEDEIRSQGGDIRRVVKDSWVGKCTECPKYKCGICWADKKAIYNPISPGKEGVCTLKRPDGTFKRARRSRK